MEEDIKRIKDLIETCKECKLHECINCEISWTEVQAIENLIKGYKELEERNIYLVNERKKLEELLFMSNENYIEKSKAREKVIEIKNKPVKDNCITASQGKLDTIIAIEELLED